MEKEEKYDGLLERIIETDLAFPITELIKDVKKGIVNGGSLPLCMMLVIQSVYEKYETEVNELSEAELKSLSTILLKLIRNLVFEELKEHLSEDAYNNLILDGMLMFEEAKKVTY
jgi:hypothetical protein